MRHAPGHRPVSDRHASDGRSVVALGGGHGLAATPAGRPPLRRRAHRHRVGGRRRRLERPAAPRPRHPRARRPAPLPRRPRPTRRNAVAAGLRAPLRRGRAEGHALGNLVIAGLADATGDFSAPWPRPAACSTPRAASCPPPSSPSSSRPSRPTAATVEGQVNVADGRAASPRVSLVPPDAEPPPAGARRHRPPPTRSSSARARCSPACSPSSPSRPSARPSPRRRRRKVYVCNLRPQSPRRAGFDVAAHVDALRPRRRARRRARATRRASPRAARRTTRGGRAAGWPAPTAGPRPGQTGSSPARSGRIGAPTTRPAEGHRMTVASASTGSAASAATSSGPPSKRGPTSTSSPSTTSTSPEINAHLLKYDSTHGTLGRRGQGHRRRHHRRRRLVQGLRRARPQGPAVGRPRRRRRHRVDRHLHRRREGRGPPRGRRPPRRSSPPRPPTSTPRSWSASTTTRSTRPSTRSSPTPRARPTASCRWSRCSTTPSASRRA